MNKKEIKMNKKKVKMRSTPTVFGIGLVAVLVTSATASFGEGGQTFKLLPNDGAANDQFGACVGVSGTTAIVGTAGDDDNGLDSGSAYLYSTTSGGQFAKLLASDGAVSDYFGNSVAVSGTTAIVGAYSDDDNGTDSGSAYLFDTTTGLQLAKLLPSDGAAGDFFGNSVAVSGTTAIVGTYGSAYLFDTTTGQQFAKLLPSDGAGGELFGFSVAISGTTAIVGAFQDDDNGPQSGSAYLFDTTTGQQYAKLLPNDGAANDNFGYSVAISGTIAVLGAYRDGDNGPNSGSAYLFDTTTGQQVAKLLPSDGAATDYFGLSVAISGTTAIVGAYFDDDNASNSGSAYLFDTTTGQLVAKLLTSDGAQNDYFGYSVAIGGTTALVGSYGDDDNGADSGSAYLFDLICSPASAVSRNGSGANASILTGVTDPVLGTNWVTDLDATGHSPAFATIEVYEQPSSGFFLPGGELLIDVSSPLATRALLVHFGGVVQFSIAVPNDLSLCGFTASAQGVVLGAPGYELSNALDLVAGF